MVLTRRRRFALLACVASVVLFYFKPPPGPMRAVLSRATGSNAVELLSLNPEPRFDKDLPAGRSFHHYEILGSVVLNDLETRQVASSLWWTTSGISLLSYRCFEPRHGIRVHEGGHIYDLLICFHCGHIIVYANSDAAQQCEIRDDGAIFNEILKRHNVRLPKRVGLDGVCALRDTAI